MKRTIRSISIALVCAGGLWLATGCLPPPPPDYACTGCTANDDCPGDLTCIGAGKNAGFCALEGTSKTLEECQEQQSKQ